MASGLGVAPHLFSMPQGVLRLAARLIGRQDDAERLLSSLEVDAAKARRLLGWEQPSSSEQGIIDMARDFAAQRRSRA
jgi:nucleoside-diphosphate-sugar epimerase